MILMPPAGAINLSTDKAVLIDTSAWVDFDHKRGLVEKVRQIIQENRVLVSTPIVAELLRGARGQQARQEYQKLLNIHLVVEPTREDWLKAAFVANRLDQKGHRLPLMDALIAAMATRLNADILSNDTHFVLLAKEMKFELVRD